ncbi:MAG: VanZ family protein [Acidobacteriota bacterium]
MGLWPFNFFPENKVSWLPDQNGLQFDGQGIIESSTPWLKDKKPLFPDDSISLVLWLRPLMEQKNLPHIVTLYDGQSLELFMIGQWRSHLVIRSRADGPATGKRGKSYREMGLDNALLKNQEVFISITSGPEGSTLYLNGQRMQFYPHHRLLTGAGSGNVRFVLGNAATGQSGWTGSFLGLAIYDRVLSADQVSRNYRSLSLNDPLLMKQGADPIGLYNFTEKRGAIIHNRVTADDTLIISEMFRPVQRRVLDPPWRDFRWNSSFAWDVAVNIAGFVPLGFFFAAFARRTSRIRSRRLYALIAMLGFGLSLAIELLQVYLPTRYSQLSDVFCNVTGTILGLIMFCMYERLDQSPVGRMELLKKS